MKPILDIAIQDCLTIGPPDNWDFSKKIVENYGSKVHDEMKNILESLRSIQPDWEAESFDKFGKRVRVTIKSQYPFLENESVNVLTNRVMYGWK